MLDAGLPTRKLILCHMDKRPDFALHRSLAQNGIALEYRTFFRPKYHPDQNVWPLLHRMVEAGLENHVVIATDMADVPVWQRLGAGPGLTALLAAIIPRLKNIGHPFSTVRKLTGEDTAHRLARAETQKDSRA
jgi:phosphotriesterase-related protein